MRMERTPLTVGYKGTETERSEEVNDSLGLQKEPALSAP